MKAYMDYICDTLLTKDTGILMSDQIDKNDATYIAWAKDETINLYTYLNYAISKTGSILPNLEAVLIPVQKRFIRRF